MNDIETINMTLTETQDDGSEVVTQSVAYVIKSRADLEALLGPEVRPVRIAPH